MFNKKVKKESIAENVDVLKNTVSTLKLLKTGVFV